MSRCHTRALLVALALAPCAAPAQQSAAGPRAAPLLGAVGRRRIDRVFAQYDRSDTPGCALGVFQNGSAAYTRGYGMADLERGVRITPATLFDIGSTSKQFAAASIALLAEDGKLRFTDDVRRYIPELPDYGAPITIDHLLHHTSGLRDYTGLLTLAGHSLEEVTTDSQALAVIVRQRHLDFPTGSRYEYSNTGFFLLSVIVKRVTGRSLADFARSRIFLPLGMTHTRYRNRWAMLLPGRALGYAPDSAGGYRNSMSNWEQTGDGALHLSVEDARAWDENFYHPRVGGPRMVAWLQERGTLRSGDSIAYARGLFVGRYRGLRRVAHGGDWIGYHAAFTRFPDQHTSVIVLCNSDDIAPTMLADSVADIVLARAFRDSATTVAAGLAHRSATEPAARSSGPALADTEIVGSYFVARTNTVMRVTTTGDTLVLNVGGASLPLARTGPATLAVLGYPATIDFARDDRGAVRSMRLRVASEDDEEAVRLTPVTPSADELRTYVGDYYSPELDVTWPIALERGGLVLRTRREALVDIGGPLEPAMRDAFTAGGVFIRFTRDASGRVTGFDASASRMRDIRFDLRAR